MKRRTFFATALVAGLGLTVQARAATQWDLASAYPAFNFHSQNLAQFAKDVDAATQGELKITVHAGASLFKMPEIKRAVQGGQAQAGEFFMVSFQNEWQPFGVDGLPFLAGNYDEAWKLYQAQKPALQKKLDQQGMVLLYAVAWPPQSIYSNKPIHSGADLKGLKWRVYSPTTARIGELVGAQPVTIQEAELSQALATGVIEGLITSSATGADNKLYENMKYFTNVQAWIPKNAVVANKKAVEALSPAARDALLKAAAAAEQRGWEASRKVDADSIAKLKAGGMEIVEPSAQLKADLAKVGDTVIQEWTAKAGDEGKQILDAYRASR
ncbi:TRAP transporter substrate-binding protein [Castellaniella defragrans]|uniref:TRAP transporter solute receptor n=2 Tax=Castellaniella defragrans TaxID=75697 RepID=W8X4W7_CASD6|nr:TRAP transporter substrate-binding protein [Castellaniella defragrans]KAB0618994.1 TRAP transporter substrate-binding protein [Castellaniella defragrans]MBB6083045.1 TRAP-type C4-dicarboxylate transport system substrate-binding protein [Castellaniella defragrans]CDM25127.1 TRAP transporter solute receptor [Castellaniella defragrans 65Phen]